MAESQWELYTITQNTNYGTYKHDINKGLARVELIENKAGLTEIAKNFCEAQARKMRR